MADFDIAGNGEPTPDAETLLTPITKIGPTPRAQLVRKLSDIVVLPTGRISSNERALVADILLQVVDNVEIELRMEIAVRVARVAECPPALIHALLIDEPEVAEKIISGAQTIPEALLIEAAQEGGQAHRLMIAKRPDLTTAVADAVLRKGEPDVCIAVLKRDECRLSPNAINTLVALSATRKDLQPLLLRRSELEPAHGFMMFWWVDAERRKRILARFSLDRRIIQDVLADLYPKVFRSKTDPDPFVRDILILAERRHRPRGMDGERVGMDVVLRTLAAAQKYPAQEIIDAVAMVAGISRELAARILRDPGGEPHAVMCKSLGIPRDDFFALFETEDGEDEQATEKAEYLLGIFDSMARDFSRAVLRYWDWDSNPRIALITRLLGLEQGLGIEQEADLKQKLGLAEEFVD